MDRQFVPLIATLALSVASLSASRAQGNAGDSPKPTTSPAKPSGVLPPQQIRREPQEQEDLRDADAKARPVDILQKKLEDLSPEERQRMRKNAERWIQLNPDERKTLRDREDDRREHMKHEADAALKDSGLVLDADRREIFEVRYTQERRKIEQRLHTEMVEKRQQLLPDLASRLKAEFSAPGSSTTASPAAR